MIEGWDINMCCVEGSYNKSQSYVTKPRGPGFRRGFISGQTGTCRRYFKLRLMWTKCQLVLCYAIPRVVNQTVTITNLCRSYVKQYWKMNLRRFSNVPATFATPLHIVSSNLSVKIINPLGRGVIADDSMEHGQWTPSRSRQLTICRGMGTCTLGMTSRVENTRI